MLSEAMSKETPSSSIVTGLATAKAGKNTKGEYMTSLLLRRLNSGNQCNNYMISRAFIPPWSLVMTKPETLGPDTSRKEAGTLVSRYNFTGK
jgi:hypothetical protein